jgi:hypothetical protein
MGFREGAKRVGLSTAYSSCPGPLARYVWEALSEARKDGVRPVATLDEELRDLVKDAYGDDFDGVSVNSCESALRVSFDVLVAPPIMARGASYRSKFIAPYGHDDEYMAGYGRPFPPKYKNLWVDRSVSAGEAGVEAKALTNLDVILVKLAGAKYEVHGINANTCPLLVDVDPERSALKIRDTVRSHAETLSGFTTIGQDTPGYGFGAKNDRRVPELQKSIGRFSEEYDVPYILDAALGVPVIGTHPRDVNATVMAFSMDKAVHAITSGLIVGREEEMAQIRKALGRHGERTGVPSSHGKAAYSFADPGREAMFGQIAVLKTILSKPKTITDPVDTMYKIALEEFSLLEPSWLRDGLLITKSYHCGSVEIDYERTWKDDSFGIPIFSIEDSFTDTNLIMSSLSELGVLPPSIYDGMILMTPGFNDVDEEGNLKEEGLRLSIKALVSTIEIVCRHAGIV